MRRHGTSLFIVFSIFLLISIVLFSVYRNQPSRKNTGFLESIFSPLQGGFQFLNIGGGTSEVKKLREENANLRRKIVDQSELEKEVKALQAQYQTTKVTSSSLLPVHVIGRRGFMPGVTIPNEITIDRGAQDGLRAGQVVVYQDNVVGKIKMTSARISTVDLIWNPSFILTAETVKTQAPGIVRGVGKGFMNLTNVLLSDAIEISDFVVTKGDVDANDNGFPPGLVIGKVITIDKKPSNLFQVAGVESLINISDLDTVFVITKN